MKFLFRAIGQRHFIDDRRGSGDEIEIELALEAFLNDFEMQQAEEAAAETEAEGGGRFHFEGEGSVVEAKFADCCAQVFEVGRIDREETAEHHGLCWLEAGQGLRRRALVVGDGIADARIGDFLDRGGDEADLAGAEAVDIDHLRGQHTDALDAVFRARTHHADLLTLAQHAVDDAHENHDAEIGVVPAINQQRLQRPVFTDFAFRRR
ncbi:hypothetical protein D3C72_1263450 [compost metagenome]